MPDTSIFGSVLTEVTATATATVNLEHNVQTGFQIFQATAGGTGYSNGDILANILLTDTSTTPQTCVASWQNMTTGVVLSVAPTGGTYAPIVGSVKITDGTLVNTLKPLNVQVTGTDLGMVTNTVIHGLTTAGGGGYVDVKVNPSGALSVDASGSTVTLNNGSTSYSVYSGVWYDDTSTPLAANASFTSTARDLAGATSGTTFPVTAHGREYRVIAMQDQTFTLQIWGSRDNVTFYQLSSIASALVGTNQIAETVVYPKMRYYRYVILNGAGTPTYTIGSSFVIA